MAARRPVRKTAVNTGCESIGMHRNGRTCDARRMARYMPYNRDPHKDSSQPGLGSKPPWLSPTTSLKVSLDEEIRLFARYVEPNAEEQSARATLFLRLEKAAHVAFGECRIELFGSSAVNLDLHSSDIDVRVHGEKGPSPLHDLRDAITAAAGLRTFESLTTPGFRS